MAKASSPVRLQADLMAAANATGKLMHRSAAEQIEFWASVGRRVTSQLSQDNLIALSSGLANIKVEPVNSGTVDPEAVFAALDNDRITGTLTNELLQIGTRYQVSRCHPGYLEQIDENGHVTVGQFSHGKFMPLAN